MPFEITKQATAAVMAGSMAGAPVPANIQSITPVETVTYETVMREQCVTDVYEKSRFGFRTELSYVPRCYPVETTEPVSRMVYRVVYIENNQMRVIELDKDPRS